MNFSDALNEVKNGASIQRANWNGKDLVVKLQVPDAHSKMTKPYLYLEYPDQTRVPWCPSQTDILGDDWQEVVLDRS